MTSFSLRSLLVALFAAASGCASPAPTIFVPLPPPPTSSCQVALDASPAGALCLSGTASTGTFTAPVRGMVANLFHVFPFGLGAPSATQRVASDGTWAFGGLAAGPHYYVQVLLFFENVAQPVSQIVGPLVVQQGHASVGVVMKPVELDVLESRPADAGMAIDWASAHVFNPSTGMELTGTASVAITVGGASMPLPWDGTRGAYFLPFSPSPLAQAAYTVTTQDNSLDAGVLSWQLAGNAPMIDGLVTAPLDAGVDGGPLVANEPMLVTWTPEPVDYVSVELFEREGAADAGSWQITYPPPDGGAPTAAPDAGRTTIPSSSVSTAGLYLLNVAYANSNCPVTADGCVLAAAVAGEELNVVGP